jgi:hypothetical protein
MVLLQGCHHVTQQELQDRVLGGWEEVHGTKETLFFNVDGTVYMNSPVEHHLCTYDLPDPQHIRLDCAPVGTPPRPMVWKVELTSDRLIISGNREVGTYKRKYTFHPASLHS